MKFFLWLVLLHYLFWGVASLFLFPNLTVAFAFPPLLWFMPKYLSQFGDFLAVPFSIALVMGIFTALFVAKAERFSSWSTAKRVIFINSVFLLSFLLSATFHKIAVVNRATTAIQADCSHKVSFLASLYVAGHGRAAPQHHGFVIKNGKVLLWSFKTLSFYQVYDKLSRNMDLSFCEKHHP